MDERRRRRRLPTMSHRGRQLLVAAVLCWIDARLQNAHVMGASASAAPRGRFGRLMGRRRSQVDNVDDGGLTLGQLEEMMRKDDGDGGGSKSDALGPSAVMGADGSANNAWSQRPSPERTYEATQASPTATQLRRGLGRINLDLSGRIMCHLVSPNTDSVRDVYGETAPLFTLPSKQPTPDRQETLPVARMLQRYAPNLYLGANYDLDEVWYGATRWIARCSWGPLAPSLAWEIESKVGEVGGADDSLASNALQLAQQLQRRILPSSPFSLGSRWTIDAEGERSVFDGRDTTTRLRLVQSPSSSLTSPETTAVQSPLQLSLERDSAKYHEAPRGTKRSIQYAPAFTANLRTPVLLHPRLQLHTKRTWIVREGGDRHGNYYGGDHFGGESCADRRLECLKTRFREGIPRSNPAPNDASANGKQGFGSKLSRWLENDGWMPKRVTADLAGNLVSVSEVGFGGDTGESKPSRASMSPLRNAGIRLRVSKKMDWTTLGIFPWSRNGMNGHGQDEGNAVLDALQSTHLQLELCGLHGSGAGRSSIAVHVDPLDWRRSLKFVVGQESVSIA